MEIMQWVKKQGENKDTRYYLFLVLMFLSAFYLAIWKIARANYPLPKTLAEIVWDSHFLWYIPFAVALVGIVYIWVYYAPVVCKNLNHLKDAFPNSGYHNLYKCFEGWLRQLCWKRSDGSWFFKISYTIFWTLYLICFIYYYCSVFSRYFQNDGSFYYFCGFMAFFILTVTITILNYSSCYICIAFVYFLIRICRLDKDNPLDYLREIPSTTFGLQLLNHTANTICLYFFLDSFFCMLGFYCFRQIISVDNLSMTWALWAALFYAAFFLFTFGLIGCVGIVLGSRICLRRLHSEWKFRSLKEYEGKKRKDPKDTAVSQAMEKLATDKMPTRLLESMIPIGAFVTNIVTIYTILIP